MNEKKILGALNDIHSEFNSANEKFKPFSTYHEGYAVILEELDELWDEVKSRDHSHYRMKKEAIQVAAMAIRFIYDLLEGEERMK